MRFAILAVDARQQVVALNLEAASPALAQTDRWYPSPWGPEDQRGAANRLTPEKVLEARNLIRTQHGIIRHHCFAMGLDRPSDVPEKD